MKRWMLLLILGSVLSGTSAQTLSREIPQSFCVSSMEYKLYRMINDYRRRYDLPAIPLSRSLCYVATLHVRDLAVNHPDEEPCNFHSWSDKGLWKPFCYPRDEKKNNSVWDKPKELTHYKGKGYEIVYWENSDAVIDSIIAFWRSIDYFNGFLMNTGKWQGKKWNAIGIAISGNYAVAWFGELADPEGKPRVCGLDEPKPEVSPVMVQPDTLNPVGKSDTLPVPKPAVKPKPQPKKTEPKRDSLTSATKPVSQPKPAEPGNYYIIVKSLSPEPEMKKALDGLLSQGFSDAKLVGPPEKLRLSIQNFSEKARADSALREVKKTWKDAWMLKY